MPTVDVNGTENRVTGALHRPRESGFGIDRNPQGADARPSPLRPEPDRAGAVRLRLALGAKHVRECFRLAVISEEPRLPVHHREVAGRQGGKVRDAARCREREPGLERLLHLLRREVVEPHLEDESPQGGRGRGARRSSWCTRRGTGAAFQRPAVISVNMFAASLAVNEFLARLHPFREERNATWAAVEFSLASMELFGDPEEGICKRIAGNVGKGDVKPLLNLLELAERRAA